MDRREDDTEILLKIRKGNQAAMAQLIDKYKLPLYGYLFRMVGSECDDVFQDTWVKVWKNVHKFDIERPFRPWLFAVASNLCRDFWRKQKTREKYEKDTRSSIISDANTANIDVKRALKHLTPEEKNTLILRYYEQFTEKETSDILKIPVGTVKSRVHKALKKLRKVINKDA